MKKLITLFTFMLAFGLAFEGSAQIKRVEVAGNYLVVTEFEI